MSTEDCLEIVLSTAYISGPHVSGVPSKILTFWVTEAEDPRHMFSTVPRESLPLTPTGKDVNILAVCGFLLNLTLSMKLRPSGEAAVSPEQTQKPKHQHSSSG